MNLEKGVLEEVIRRAMEEGILLANKSDLNDYESGLLFGYFAVIDWAKQGAEVWDIVFDDKQIQAFDPYTLLIHKKNDSSQDSKDQTN